MRGRTFLFAVALGVPLVAQGQDPDLSSQLEQSAATSPKEKLDFASSAIEEMFSAEKSVRKLLESAEKEGESAADKVKCVSIKLTSIRALQGVTEGAVDSMNQAIADRDDAMADHHFRKVAVAIDKVRQLVAEAEACAGQTGQTGGTANVDVTGDFATEDIDDYFSQLDDDVPSADVTPFE